MSGTIRAGDVVVCRVNGTKDLYVIGSVAAGTVGELSLSGVTTIVGLNQAIERGYRDRTPDERVWLLDGAALAYVNTSAPRGQLYHVKPTTSLPAPTPSGLNGVAGVHNRTASADAAP